jgi:hypothetical protein
MPPLGEVVLLTHQAVSAPGHRVSNARRDLETAPGADVKLRRRGRCEWLHIPEPIPPGFGRQATDQRTAQVDLGVIVARTPPAGAIRSRHAPSLSRLGSQPARVVDRLEPRLFEVEHRLCAIQDA